MVIDTVMLSQGSPNGSCITVFCFFRRFNVCIGLAAARMQAPPNLIQSRCSLGESSQAVLGLQLKDIATSDSKLQTSHAFSVGVSVAAEGARFRGLSAMNGTIVCSRSIVRASYVVGRAFAVCNLQAKQCPAKGALGSACQAQHKAQGLI